jgi:hypothetical protein
MNDAEIRQEIRNLEAKIARDGTRYDQAFAIGQYELANNIQIGINEIRHLQKIYAEQISQQAQPAPFPRSKFRSDTGEFFSFLFRCWCCSCGSQSFSVPSSTSHQGQNFVILFLTD